MSEGDGSGGSGSGLGAGTGAAATRVRSRTAEIIPGNYTLPLMAAPLTPGPAHTDAELAHVLRIERPHPSLLIYYALASLVAGPFFFIPLVPLYFRYHTMRYRFEADGVKMRWGILFRREVSLTYARVQDIHLTSNLVERWLGLAEVKLSTASGSTGAEMTIEGLREFELVRDFLYAKMRGGRDKPAAPRAAAPGGGEDGLAAVAAALRQVSEDLRAVRAVLERRGGGSR
jgi:putative membrane protein